MTACITPEDRKLNFPLRQFVLSQVRFDFSLRPHNSNYKGFENMWKLWKDDTQRTGKRNPFDNYYDSHWANEIVSRYMAKYMETRPDLLKTEGIPELNELAQRLINHEKSGNALITLLAELDQENDTDFLNEAYESVMGDFNARKKAFQDSLNPDMLSPDDIIQKAVNERRQVEGVIQRDNELIDELQYMGAEGITPQFFRQHAGRKAVDMFANWDKHRSGWYQQRIDRRTAKDIHQDFGLMGVQSDQSVTGAEQEAIYTMLWDSLNDLAETLGIPEKAMGLARGNGKRLNVNVNVNDGGSRRYAAFYRHPQGDDLAGHLINLKKDIGDGSFAHEFGHAIDIGLNDATVANLAGWLDFLHKVMRYSLHNWDEDTITGTIEYQDSPLYTASQNMRTPGKGASYWASDAEMFARSFEKYVHEKMKQQGRKNDYLVQLPFVERNDVYPKGETLAVLTEHFDRMFAAMEFEPQEGGKYMRLAKIKETAPLFDDFIRDLRGRPEEQVQEEVKPDEQYVPTNFAPGLTSAAVEEGFFVRSVPHPSDIITTATLEGASAHADLELAKKLDQIITPSLKKMQETDFVENPGTDSEKIIRISDPQMNFILKALASFQEKIKIVEDEYSTMEDTESDGKYTKGSMASAGMGVGKTLIALGTSKEMMERGNSAIYLTYGTKGFSDPTYTGAANMMGITERHGGYDKIKEALKRQKKDGKPIFMELTYGQIAPTEAEQKKGLKISQKFLDIFPQGFDGLVVADEFHRAAGMEKVSKGKGKEKKIVIEPRSARSAALYALQQMSPNAAFLYMSGTALKDPSSVLSARRLGLAEKHFGGDVSRMNDKLIDADPSLLELVAQSLVHDGVMEHASLSMDGVESETLEFEPTEEQNRYFEQSSRVVLDIMRLIEDAVTQSSMLPPKKRTTPKTRMPAMIQDFYVALSSSALMENTLPKIRQDIKDGYGPGVYTENTYEASSNRLEAYNAAMEKWYDENDEFEGSKEYEKVDLKKVQATPKAMLIDWVLNPENFPIYEGNLELFDDDHLNLDGSYIGEMEVHMARNWYEVPHDPALETVVRLSSDLQKTLRSRRRGKKADEFFVVVPADTYHKRDEKGVVTTTMNGKTLMEMRDSIIYEITNLDLPMYPADMLRLAMKEDGTELVELTGRNAVWDGERYVPMPEGTDREKKIASFQGQDSKVFLLNMTAGTGVTLKHARGEPSGRRRHLYLINMGERADNALQAIFRVHRTDQQTAPRIYLGMVGKTGLRFVASIIDAAQTVLALSAGDSQSSGLDFMNKPEYDLMDGFADKMFDLWYNSTLADEYEGALQVIPGIGEKGFELRQFLNYMPMVSAVQSHRKTEKMAGEIVNYIKEKRLEAIEKGELADSAVIQAGVQGVAQVREKAVVPMTNNIELVKLRVSKFYKANKKRMGAENMKKMIRRKQNDMIISASQTRLDYPNIENPSVKRGGREIGGPRNLPIARINELRYLFSPVDTEPNSWEREEARIELLWSAIKRRSRNAIYDNSENHATAIPKDELAANAPVWKFLSPDKKTAYLAYIRIITPQGLDTKGSLKQRMDKALTEFRPVLRIETPKGETKDIPLPHDVSSEDAHKLRTELEKLLDPERNLAMRDEEAFQEAWDANVSTGGQTHEDMYVLRGDLMENLSEVLETGKHDFAQVAYQGQRYLAKRLNIKLLKSQKPHLANQIAKSAELADEIEKGGGMFKKPPVPTAKPGKKYTMTGNFILNKGRDLVVFDRGEGLWLVADMEVGSVTLPEGFEGQRTRDINAVQELLNNKGWVNIKERDF